MTLSIKGDKLIYVQDSENCWTLDIDKIKFIGEYTKSGELISNDWFFVFADTIDDWWQVPSLAVDHKQFWKQLSLKLNCELEPRLFASTDWATSVMYPKSLKGQDLFVIVKPEAKPKTFWQRIFGSVKKNEHLELTENVKLIFK